MRCGLARDYVPVRGPNKKRDMERRIREEKHLCIYCGKPLTEEDGEHKSCEACREARRAKFRERRRKKISRARSAAKKI